MAEGRGGQPDEVISSDNDNDNGEEGAAVIPAPKPEPTNNPIQENKDWIAGHTPLGHIARNDNADSNDIAIHFSEKVGSPLAAEEEGIHALGAVESASDFDTLSSAITNVTAGGTIHVTADITMTNVLNINKSINFISDGGPYSLFVSGNFRHFNLIGGTGITIDFGDLTLTRAAGLKDPVNDRKIGYPALCGGGLNQVSGIVTLIGGIIDGNRSA
ncbi:MAG: hypothetical protein LBN34_01525, partial [Clostridiales Family XIII bacterium]|nr:hypothetical protein [Clostridiales Family XIII bacterium]